MLIFACLLAGIPLRAFAAYPHQKNSLEGPEDSAFERLLDLYSNLDDTAEGQFPSAAERYDQDDDSMYYWEVLECIARDPRDSIYAEPADLINVKTSILGTAQELAEEEPAIQASPVGVHTHSFPEQPTGHEDDVVASPVPDVGSASNLSSLQAAMHSPETIQAEPLPIVIENGWLPAKTLSFAIAAIVFLAGHFGKPGSA